MAESEAVEVEVTPQSLNFTILGTKVLSSAIKLACWSKTMDVVVFVDEQNNLTMRRRNWQRIWSASENREFTSLTWKSDGKSVVTGYADGHYTIWDIESGMVMFSTVKHGSSAHLSRSPVSAVQWSHPHTSSRFRPSKKYNDSGRTSLAPLWPLNGVDAPSGVFFSSSTMDDDQLSLGNQLQVGDSSTTRLEQSEPSTLDVLTVSHSDGVVYLYAFGTFEIGRIEVSSILKSAKPALSFGSVGVISSHFNPDLTRLQLVVQLRAKDDSVRFDETGAEVGPDGSTVLVSVDTQLLKRRQSELVAVAWQSTLIQDLYYRIAALTEKMALMWSSTITPFITKMKNFETALCPSSDNRNTFSNAHSQEKVGSSFNGSFSLESVFLDLLATGKRSNELESMLIVNLGPKNAEKMLMSFEAACDNLEHLVNQHLRPTAERLMFRLVTLESYRKYTLAFGPLGLSAPLIEQMRNVVQKMISHCGNFVLHLTRSRLLYVNFLKWLFLHTFDDDAEVPELAVDNYFVSQFLKGDMRADPIGELIRGKLMPAVSSTSLAAKPPFQTTSPVPTSIPPPAVPRGLDDSGLGMDESLNYSYMSLEPIEDANMSFAIDEPISMATPQKPLGFKHPMTSSPEQSHMGPITLIDLPDSLEIIPDPMDTLSAAKPAPFKSEANESFSGLRTLVHQQADSLFESLSKSLSTNYRLESLLVLFTRPELLKSDDMLTEVFPMQDLVSVMKAEHSFQFYDVEGAEPQVHLTFKDASSLWTLKLTNSESFAVSGVELSALVYEEGTEFSEEVVIDLQYYKDQQMLAVIKEASGSRCQVQKLSLDSLQYYTSKIDVANTSKGMINYFDEVVMMHPFQHTSEETMQQQRDFAVDALALSVSGPRGVGFIIAAPRKCLILDFDTDETPEEEEVAEVAE